MLTNTYPTLQFNLGEEVEMMRTSVRNFVDDKVAPRAAEIDSTDVFPRDLWPLMGQLGLFGVTVSEDHGGSNLGYMAQAIIVEELCRGSASVGLSYGSHANLCVNQINRWASEAQKEKYLPKE